MIKVEHTKTHELSLHGLVATRPRTTALVTDAKLVLVEVDRGRFAKLIDTTDGEVTFNLQPNENAFKLDKSVKECHIIPVKPILISETEKIEVGDWYYGGETKRSLVQIKDQRQLEYIRHVSEKFTFKYFKILALPEHFSPQQLQMIVDGKLKDGDKVLVECEFVDQLGLSTYIIHLNPHITIYHPVEEKMYSKDEMKKLMRMLAFRFHARKEEFNEWFEQNVI